MSDNNILINFLLEDTGFKASVQAASDKVDQLVSGVKDVGHGAKESAEGVKSLGESFKSALEAAAAFFAVEKILDFKNEVVAAAAAQEDTQRRLAQAMALTGSYTDEAREKMEAFTSSLQANSRFSEETINSSLAVAKTFGLTNEQAQKLVQVSADLATQLGTDLNTQVEKLGITFSGSTGRLTRMFPELKQFSEEQLRAGAAVDFLAGRLQGAAESEVHTYTGAVTQAGFAHEDFLKSLGRLVTDSPVMIARIEAMADAWKAATKWVQDNKDLLQEYVNDGVAVLVQAVPAGIATISALATVFEALAQVTGLFFVSWTEGVAEFTSGLTSVFVEPIKFVADFVGSIQTLVETIPGMSDALEAAGVSTGSLSEETAALEKSISDFGESADRVTRKTAEDTAQSVSDMSDSFDKFDAMLDSAGQSAEDSAQRIIDANAKVVADRVQNRPTPDNSFMSAEELNQYQQELKKIEDQIFNDTAEDEEKSRKLWQDHYDTLEELAHKGVISRKQANMLERAEDEIFAQQLLKIKNDELNEGQALLEKALKEQEAAIKAAGENPIGWLIKLHEDPADLLAMQDDVSTYLGNAATSFAKDLKAATKSMFGDKSSDSDLVEWTGDEVGAGIAAALSALKDGQNGAAAAKDFFANTVGAVVDAYVPGLGQVIKALIDQFAQDPALNEAWGKSFTAALPVIADNLGRSLPAIISGMFDVLKDPQFWEAIVAACFSIYEQAFKEIGKALGIHVGESLNADHFGKTVSDGWNRDMAWWKTSGYKIGQDAGKGITDGIQKGIDYFESWGNKFKAFWPEAGGLLKQAIVDGGNTVAEWWKKAFDAVSDALDRFWKSIQGVFQPQIDAFNLNLQNFKDFFAKLKLPEFAEPAWLRSFTDAIDKFAKLTSPGSLDGKAKGAAGGVESFFSNAAQGLHLATGALVTGSGTGDTVPAMLAPGELVVDRTTGPRLNAFMDKYEGEGAASSGTGGADNSAVLMLLSQVIALLKQPMAVTSTATLNGKALADIVLNLNRTNARTA